MDRTQLIVVAAVIAIIAFRLYQKYIKRGKVNPGSQTKITPGSTYFSSSKDDDYEPYAKK